MRPRRVKGSGVVGSLAGELAGHPCLALPPRICRPVEVTAPNFTVGLAGANHEGATDGLQHRVVAGAERDQVRVLVRVATLFQRNQVMNVEGAMGALPSQQQGRCAAVTVASAYGRGGRPPAESVVDAAHRSPDKRLPEMADITRV
jgi:hypothetical protein